MAGARHRIALSFVIAALLGLAGCGGGGKSSGAPEPTGSGTLRGVIALSTGQSASDLVVQVEGTSLRVQPAPDGSFEIRGVPPGSYTLSAFSSTTNVGAHVPVVVGSGGEVRVPDIRLAAAGQIAGIVSAFDADGGQRPQGGAAVVACPASDVAIMGAGLASRPADAETTPPLDPAIRLAATSADDGTYALKGVTPGAYLVTATLGNLGSQEQLVWVQAAHTAAADFTLGQPAEPRLGKLSGKVVTRTATGEMKPVADARITIDGGIVYATGGLAEAGTSGSSDASLMPPYPGYGEGVTDEAGTYSMTVPQGRHTVQCRHQDYMTAAADVDVAAASTLDFTLEAAPGERPRLQLTAATGKPSYPWGQTVDVSMALRNTGTVPVTLTFDGQEASFAVLRGDEAVWSYGGFVGPVPLMEVATRSRRRLTTTLSAVLNPGDTREYQVVWDQRGFDGTLVDPGDFVLKGSVLLNRLYGGSPILEAAPVTFRITR